MQSFSQVDILLFTTEAPSSSQFEAHLLKVCNTQTQTQTQAQTPGTDTATVTDTPSFIFSLVFRLRLDNGIIWCQSG